MNLGKTIKTIRKNKKLTQLEFCNKIGLTQSYLSKIERNDREPSIDVLKKISQELEIPMPILCLLAFDEKDIHEDKKEIFKSLKPSIENLMSLFLTKNQ